MLPQFPVYFRKHQIIKNRVKGCFWTRNDIPKEKRNVVLVYSIVLFTTCLDNINSSATLTLQANIQEPFNTTSSTATCVLSGYILILGSFIIIAGKVADIIGCHNLYLSGLTIVWICSLICACIPHNSIIPLTIFRAIHGIGASALVPSTLALAANYFTGEYSRYLMYAIMDFIISVTGTLGLGLILGVAFVETSIGYKSFFILLLQ